MLMKFFPTTPGGSSSFPPNLTGVLIHTDGLFFFPLCYSVLVSPHLPLKPESELQEDGGKRPHVLTSFHYTEPCQRSDCMWSRLESLRAESLKPKRYELFWLLSLRIREMEKEKIIGERSGYESFSNAKTFGTQNSTGWRCLRFCRREGKQVEILMLRF